MTYWIAALIFGIGLGYGAAAINTKKWRITAFAVTALIPVCVYFAFLFSQGCQLDGTGDGECYGMTFAYMLMAFALPPWLIAVAAGCFVRRTIKRHQRRRADKSHDDELRSS